MSTTLTGRSMKLARSIIKPKLPSKHRDNLMLNVSRTLVTPATSTRVDYQPTIPITSLDLKLAGQLVDTPVNHFDIRNLLREEAILSAFALEKVSSLQSGLSSTHHPIISVAQEIFQDSDTKWINSLGGFTLLLLAKSLESVPSYNCNHNKQHQSTNFSENIWEKQKIFAECYEMIDKAMYIHHQSIINIPVKSSSESNVIDGTINKTNTILNNGNKLAVLGGDYLFSFGIIRLASVVKRANVFDFIGAAIDEFCINQFDNYQREISNYIKPKSDMNMETWEKYGGYCSAKLAAYSAQFITTLTNLSSKRFEQSAFDFGYNLKLKWNLEEDIQTIIDTNSRRYNPISAPIIKYMEKDPQFIDYLSKLDWEKEDTISKVKKILLKSNVIDECQSLSKLYSDKCIKLLQLFPDCQSRRLLESIAKGNLSN